MTKRKKPPEPPDRSGQREFDFQADFYDEKPFDCPSADVDTSQAAAGAIRALAQTARLHVLMTLAHQGLTQDEYAEQYNRAMHSVCPRFWELENRHWIEKTKDKRPTRAGRMARVYQLTNLGWEAVHDVRKMRGETS